MSEKRFSVDIDGITIIDNLTDCLTECKYSYEAGALCKVLNELVDEIEYLKKEKEWLMCNCVPYEMKNVIKNELEELKKELSE